MYKTSLRTLDHQFSRFAKGTLRQKCPDKNYVISQLKYYQKEYNRGGFFEEFLFRLENFAYDMESVGGLDIAGMVFSKLAKFPAHPRIKEQFLYSALRIAQKQKDDIHTLARIVDLKNLYRRSNDHKRAYRMLFSEEKLLTDIVENFDAAKNKFRTVSKHPAALNTYKYQLAAAKVDIAKGLKPKDAYYRLIEAREIFASIACDSKVVFIDRLLSNHYNKKF